MARPFRAKLVERLCDLIEDQNAGKKISVPPAGAQLWYWFKELDTQRQGNGFGMNALGFREIKAWADLRELRLLPWQLDGLLALDLKRRTVAASDKADKPKDQESSRPLTSRLFDALFPGRTSK